MAGPTTRRATVTSALNFSSLQPGQQAVIAVVLDIAPGLHAQSHTPLAANLIPLRVSVDANPAIKTLEEIYPEPKIEEYPALGKLSVYAGRAIVYVPIEVSRDATPGELKLSGKLSYQICNDNTCFAPESPAWSVSAQIVAANQEIKPANAELFTAFDPHVFVRRSTPAISPVLFLSAFVIGIIFNVMPCVLPVVPLKIMGFYEASRHSRAKSVLLGTVFSLGIVTTFAALALLVLVYRKLEWGQLFGNPYFTIAVIVILLAMALQTFGTFEVILPQAVYRYTPSHETVLGNYFFGIFTAVLSTPCTFGMFLSLLITAASQPGLVGVMLLMTVGLGMAAPYLILSAFPGVAKDLPRSGPWAEIVKQLMGFLLIGVAIYFARRFLGENLGGHNFWWILFGVIAAAALFLVVRTGKIAKTRLGVVVAVLIALLMVGPSLGVTLRLTYVPIDWQPFSQQALDQAKAENRPVVVDFTAVWCLNCQTVESTVFTDKQIVALVKEKNLLMLRADLTDENAPGWALLKQLNPVGAIPLTAVYLPSSNSDQPLKLAGIYSSADLLKAFEALTTSSMRNPS